MINFHNFPYLFSSAISILLGVYILSRDVKNRVNQAWCLLGISTFLWSLGFGLMLFAGTKSNAVFWGNLSHVGASLLPVAYLNFILSLVGKINSKKKLLFLSYCLGIFFAIASLTPFLIKDFKPKLAFNYYFQPGFLYLGFTIMFFCLAAIAFYELIDSLRTSFGISRNQLTYVAIASFIGFGSGATTFPLVFDIQLYPLGGIVFLYNIIITFAIVKYRLMDIRVAFTRAGIFGIVYTLILFILLSVVKYSRASFQELLGQNWWIAILVIGMFLATLGPFIYNYLRNRAENIIFKEKRRYQKALVNLCKSMVNIRDSEQLFKTIDSTVVDAVKIKFAVMYLKQEEYKSFQLKNCYPQEAKSLFPELISLDDPLISILNQRKKPLLSEEIGLQNKINPDLGLIIPCFSKDGLLGFIVLGAKENNQMYTDDDILSFENLSYATSLAIENCTYWKEIEDRQRKARLQEMDTFSYSLAHEIDNPMTIVYNLARFQKEHFLKYITDPQERKDAEEACDIMMEGSGRVMSMVKAIRQFGQKVSGELEPLNLQEVIEGFGRLYSPEIKANCVLFSKEMPEEPIYVKGVAAELQQVLMIFAKNAIHAMQSSKEKKLTLKVIKVNHSTVRIALSDTGYGVKKGYLQTIFAPFFTSKASTEGTGMGLHNAKGFILRHNGRIWADSEGENKGSTFFVELPVIKDIKPENIKKDEGKTKWAF